MWVTEQEQKAKTKKRKIYNALFHIIVFQFQFCLDSQGGEGVVCCPEIGENQFLKKSGEQKGEIQFLKRNREQTWGLKAHKKYPLCLSSKKWLTIYCSSTRIPRNRNGQRQPQWSNNTRFQTPNFQQIMKWQFLLAKPV